MGCTLSELHDLKLKGKRLQTMVAIFIHLPQLFDGHQEFHCELLVDLLSGIQLFLLSDLTLMSLSSIFRLFDRYNNGQL